MTPENQEQYDLIHDWKPGTRKLLRLLEVLIHEREKKTSKLLSAKDLQDQCGYPTDPAARKSVENLREHLDLFYGRTGPENKGLLHFTIPIPEASHGYAITISKLLPSESVEPEAPSVGMGFEGPPTTPAMAFGDARPQVPLPWVGRAHLRELGKEILARDGEARQVLRALNSKARIIPIMAPAGFGKSALMARVIKLALGETLEPSRAGLSGIAVLDAARPDDGAPCLSPKHIASSLDQVQGGSVAGSAMDKDREAGNDSCAQFFDCLGRAGKVWIIIENAEEIIRSADAWPAFRSFLGGWGSGYHDVKLVLLTRDALPSRFECEADLSGVRGSLRRGLPAWAAIKLLRNTLKPAPRFKNAKKDLLHELAVTRLKGIPVLIEQFAGYLLHRENNIPALDWNFVRENEPLRQFSEDQQIGRFFHRIIGDQVKGLDPVSRQLVHFVAKAKFAVPRAGVLRVEQELSGSSESNVFTRLERSGLLQRRDNFWREESNVTMHALVRLAVLENLEDAPLDRLAISSALYTAARDCLDQRRVRDSNNLAVLAVVNFPVDTGVASYEVFWESYVILSCARRMLGEVTEAESGFKVAIQELEAESPTAYRDEALARSMRELGIIHASRGEWAEAQENLSHAIALLRSAQSNEADQSPYLEGQLATTLLRQGVVLRDSGNEPEAKRAFLESTHILNGLVKDGHRETEGYLAVATMHLAFFEEHLHEVKEKLDKAVDHLRRLADSERQHRWREELAEAFYQRGWFLMRRTDASLRDCSNIIQAVWMLDYLVRQENRRDLEPLLFSAQKAEVAVFSRGMFKGKAEKRADRLEKELERLVSEEKRLSLVRELAEVQLLGALVSAKRGHLDLALEKAQKAMESFTRFNAEDPTNEWIRLQIAKCDTVFAAIQYRRGQHHEACVSQERAVSGLRSLRKLWTGHWRLATEIEYVAALSQWNVLLNRTGSFSMGLAALESGAARIRQMERTRGWRFALWYFLGMHALGRLLCWVGRIKIDSYDLPHHPSAQGRFPHLFMADEFWFWGRSFCHRQHLDYKKIEGFEYDPGLDIVVALLESGKRLDLGFIGWPSWVVEAAHDQGAISLKRVVNGKTVDACIRPIRLARPILPSPLFTPEEVTEYCDRLTRAVTLFHQKQVAYSEIAHLEYDRKAALMTVVAADGARIPYGVPIHLELQPYFCEAQRITLERTRNGESMEQCILLLKQV